MQKGPLIVVSGASGSGKSTVIALVLARAKQAGFRLRLSISATTRQPRAGELDGVHYYFWTRQRFEMARQAGAFLEWAEVHGCYYGTLRTEVEPNRNEGWGVILDVDVQGMEQVRVACPDLLTVFLRANSLATYEERLRKRGTEDEPAIRRRVAAAQRELDRAGEYDRQVVNEHLDEAVAELLAIIKRQFERGTHAG
jgi:guanylate kinase